MSCPCPDCQMVYAIFRKIKEVFMALTDGYGNPIPEDTIEVNHYLWNKTKIELQAYQLTACTMGALMIASFFGISYYNGECINLQRKNEEQRVLLEKSSTPPPIDSKLDQDLVRECRSLYMEIYYEDQKFKNRPVVRDLYQELYKFPKDVRAEAWIKVQPDLANIKDK